MKYLVNPSLITPDGTCLGLACTTEVCGDNICRNNICSGVTCGKKICHAYCDCNGVVALPQGGEIGFF